MAHRENNMAPAHALGGPGEWEQWLLFLKAHPRISLEIWAIIALTNMQCLRVRKACRLAGADFNFGKQEVKIDKFKSKKATTAPILPPFSRFLAAWRAGRNKKTFKKAAGARGFVTSKSLLKWQKGLLFPSRRGAKSGYVTKDTVAKAISAARVEFKGALAPKRIRSHSGRRRQARES